MIFASGVPSDYDSEMRSFKQIAKFCSINNESVWEKLHQRHVTEHILDIVGEGNNPLMSIHDRPQCNYTRIVFVLGYRNLQQFVTHYIDLTGNVEYLKVMIQNCPESYNLQRSRTR